MQPYVPYVAGSKKPQQQQQQNHGGYNPSSLSQNSGYGQSYSAAPSPNTYAPSTYATAPAATTSGYSSAYAPASTSGYSSVYAPTSTSGYASTIKPAASVQPSAPSSTYNQTPTPDFSKALDLPPPAPQSQPAPTTNYSASGGYGGSTFPSSTGGAGSYGGNNRNDGKQYENPPATAYAVATPVGALGSAPVNTAYSGGPTGGLVSEGNPTQCHKVDYEIKGHEMQLVEIELDPEETVVAEAGAMMFLDEGIDFKAKLGDGSEPKQGFFKKLFSAGGRLLSGESLFMTHFSNKGNAKARVAFAAPFPGTIIPVNMQNYGNKIICQKDAFLCAAKGTKLSIHFNKKIGSGLFGGEGFILQKLEGDGMCFIHAGGTVIKRELRGEKLRLDTGCLVGFTEGINYDIQLVPGLKSIIFGGEGLFLATLQGHGTVWMQSLPFSRMADRIIQHAPSAGGRRQGEGSYLTGGLGDVLNGDGFGFKL